MRSGSPGAVESGCRGWLPDRRPSTSRGRPRSYSGGMGNFTELLGAQVKNEFAACQQYAAVVFASQDLPQLARFFYRQSLEERDHVTMMVQYMLDREQVTIPGIDPVRNDFADPAEPIALALAEKQVSSSRRCSLRHAPRATARRAVHAVVPQGTGGGGGVDAPPVRQPQRDGDNWFDPRTTWRGRASATPGRRLGTTGGRGAVSDSDGRR